MVYRVDLEPGDTIDLTYTQPQDFASIYIVTDCADVSASCVAGADDAGYGQPETLTFVAGTPAPGACCFETSECQIMSEQECLDGNGLFRGVWTNCDPNYCYEMQGACCFDGGGCADAHPLAMRDHGRQLRRRRDDVLLAGLSPARRRLLCRASHARSLDGQDCAWSGGLFLGEGTSCDIDPCVVPLGACCRADHPATS